MIQLTATETVATAAGYAVPAWAMIPFAVMLIMIAVGPLLARKWWDKNSHKLFVSLLLGAPVAVFLVRHGLAHELEHQIVYDYLPFVILLLTLYVITGGIHVSGDIRQVPASTLPCWEQASCFRPSWEPQGRQCCSSGLFLQ